jgi:type II secretion system protein H
MTMMKLKAQSSKLKGSLRGKSEWRMPNAQGSPKLEVRKPHVDILQRFELRISDFFRHSSFAIRHSGSAASRAFTLLELMIVVVLIGIATAVIVPQMKGTYEDARLRSASRELVGVLNIASSRAVSLNEIHRVRLDRKIGRYFVERKVREGESGAGFVPIRDVPGGEGALDKGISIEMRQPGEGSSSEADSMLASSSGDERDADQVIAFYPDGTADSREILLQDREGFRRLLRLNPITASVRIVEVERK